MTKNYILDQPTATRKLQRMAYEIVENNLDEEGIILVGIRDNGSVIAENILKLLNQISSMKVDLVHLKIDKKNPGTVELTKDIKLDDKVVIIIDDVANSGKTMLYSLKPFLDQHPKKIQTLVMIERTHKAFPVNSDYVGISVSTTLQEHIYVEVNGDVVLGAYMV